MLKKEKVVRLQLLTQIRRTRLISPALKDGVLRRILIRIIMLIAEVLTGCHWIRFILIAIMSIYALDKRYHSPLRPIS